MGTPAVDKPEVPIIVAEGWDVLFHSSVEAAERYLEPIDVKEGIYKGFDAKGRSLEINATDKEVSITLAELEPMHRDELIELLKGYIKLLGKGLPEDIDLASLITFCQKM